MNCTYGVTPEINFSRQEQHSQLKDNKELKSDINYDNSNTKVVRRFSMNG